MSTAFTFRVNFVVIVLADNAQQARERLDAQGGYEHSREVELIATTDIDDAA